jgi:predicted nucleotidyltransferase
MAVHTGPLTREAILAELARHQAELRRLSVTRIGLFGSHATGHQTPSSDIDFVVAFERPTYDNFYDLCVFLERLFGRHVDVMTEVALDTIRVPEVARSIRDSLVYA